MDQIIIDEYNNEWLSNPIRTVIIPASTQHEGHFSAEVSLIWTCPVCGCRRGDPYNTISYDGSRRLGVHGWTNPCGHVDKYKSVRTEAKFNGLNRG